MRRELRILQISLLGAVLWCTQQGAQAQVLASTAATSKVARMSMAEGIAANNRALLDLITKAGLVPVLSSSEAYTFLAPPPEAIPKLQQKSPEELKELFLDHILVGTVTSADFKDGTDVKTLGGGTLRVFRKKNSIWIDGLELKEADQLFVNGVLHQLSGIMQPKRSAF